MKTREIGLSNQTGKKKTGKRASKATPMPPVSLGQPAGQTVAAAPAPEPARAQAPAPVAPRTVNVLFSVLQPQAERVSVCGEFNGWSPEANPMEAHGEGRWQTVLALEPGRYQYKFVIDGEWAPDPEAKQNVRNAFGTLNSVVEAG
jgi:hypothetical protein